MGVIEPLAAMVRSQDRWAKFCGTDVLAELGGQGQHFPIQFDRVADMLQLTFGLNLSTRARMP